LSPPALLQFGYHDIQAKPFAVWAVGRHRVECIANENDAGAKWYGATTQATRISLAIPTLVMVSD
jgi:hypothetical protein